MRTRLRVNKMDAETKNIESLFQNLETELTKTIKSTAEVNIDPVVEQNSMREELVNLAENGKIKYTVNYIKKATFVTLEKIKETYEKKQLEATNDYITNNIISSADKLLKYFELIAEKSELEDDLKNNDLFRRDVKNIVGWVTPSIPYVGLLCGGATVGKHVALNVLNSPVTPVRPSTEIKSEECE